jgi:hypothetical protein
MVRLGDGGTRHFPMHHHVNTITNVALQDGIPSTYGPSGTNAGTQSIYKSKGGGFVQQPFNNDDKYYSSALLGPITDLLSDPNQIRPGSHHGFEAVDTEVIMIVNNGETLTNAAYLVLTHDAPCGKTGAGGTFEFCTGINPTTKKKEPMRIVQLEKDNVIPMDLLLELI